MKGQLDEAPCRAEIETECAHCGEAMRISVTHDLDIEVVEGGPDARFFEPTVDWPTFSDANILRGY